MEHEAQRAIPARTVGQQLDNGRRPQHGAAAGQRAVQVRHLRQSSALRPVPSFLRSSPQRVAKFPSVRSHSTMRHLAGRGLLLGPTSACGAC